MPARARPDIPEAERRNYSPKQAAQVIGIGETLLRELIANGEIKAFQIGKLWLIERTEIDRYIAVRKAEAAASRAGAVHSSSTCS